MEPFSLASNMDITDLCVGHSPHHRVPSSVMMMMQMMMMDCKLSDITQPFLSRLLLDSVLSRNREGNQNTLGQSLSLTTAHACSLFYALLLCTCVCMPGKQSSVCQLTTTLPHNLGDKLWHSRHSINIC